MVLQQHQALVLAAYPDVEIRVYGPPTTSGTRASFVELINQKAYCGKDPVAKKLSAERGDKKGKKCRAMRTDGAYIEAGEQDNLIVQKLNEDKTTYGIFGFSYLDQKQHMAFLVSVIWIKIQILFKVLYLMV